MAFIEQSDYKPYIKDQNLTRLLDADTTILAQAEDVALAQVRDALSSTYEVDVILATEGDARPKQVVLWVIRLVLYQLYERLPTSIMPDRVRDNYNEVMGWLKDIEDGKKPTTLLRKTHVNADGETVATTKFRFGSALAPRSHQL